MENNSDILRRALKASDETLLSIAERAGLDHSQLSRFRSGERTLRQAASDALAKALGLELRPVARKRKG